MADGELERGEVNCRLASMDSSESRWVFQDEDQSDIDEEEEDEEDEENAAQHRMDLASEEEDNVEQKLIRTGPRIDSFDVEALEVPGAHRNEYEVL